MAKSYQKLPLNGGLNFQTGNCKPLTPKKSALIDNASESQHQVAFFNVLRLNEPKPPIISRPSKSNSNRGQMIWETNYACPKYLSHKFYIFTRIRHFPNGGYRPGSVAGQLAAEGVRAGAFDIQLDASRRGFAGLRIEAKAGNGDLSPEQIEERAWLLKEGYSVHRCWSYKEILDVVLWYCEISRSEVRGYPSKFAVKPLAHGGHDERCGCELKLSEIANN